MTKNQLDKLPIKIDNFLKMENYGTSEQAG